MNISILIVDDHALVCEALRADLEKQADFQVAGTAHDAIGAVGAVSALQPDVVLVDVELPGESGLHALAKIRAAGPARILVLTAHVHDRLVEEAMSAGADGYLSKSAPSGELAEAIRAVSQGRTFLSADVRERIAPSSLRSRSPSWRTRASLLTSREREVLMRIAEGESKREVSQKMGVTVRTVETHVRNLMEKLEIHDRVALARFAIREKLVDR